MSANKQRRCLNLAGEDEPCNHPWNGDGRGTTMSTPTKSVKQVELLTAGQIAQFKRDG